MRLSVAELKRTRKELAEFSRDTKFFDDNWDALYTQYSEQWIAIYRQQVFAAGTQFEEILAVTNERGLVGRALIEYMTTQPPGYVIIT